MSLLTQFPAADKTLPKNDLGARLDYIFANRPKLPLPERVSSLAIFGSRTLWGKPVYETIEKYVQQFCPSLIVRAAEPIGVCKAAREYAEIARIPLQVHFANFAKYARGAHEHRSDSIILAADCALIVHDGKSRGSYNEVLRVIRFKKPFVYERLPLDNLFNLF